jgi:predicted chitinase
MISTHSTKTVSFWLIIALVLAALMFTSTPEPTHALAPAWVANKAYATNTLASYGGIDYKCITGHTSQVGWEPPAVPSLWVVNSGSATSVPGATATKTATASSGGITFTSLVSQSQFDNLYFPGHNSFYTYSNLVSALSAYSTFANMGDVNKNKREIAAFFANVHHETGGLVYIEEINKSNNYCSSQPYGCPAGTYQYYGRGPLQISWNYNYYAAGNALGTNLLNTPSTVATNGVMSWKVALWFWMTQTTAAGTMKPHEAMLNNSGFGQTIKTINGGIECSPYPNGTTYMQSRIDKFNSFLDSAHLNGIAAGPSNC